MFSWDSTSLKCMRKTAIGVLHIGELYNDISVLERCVHVQFFVLEVKGSFYQITFQCGWKCHIRLSMHLLPKYFVVKMSKQPKYHELTFFTAPSQI